jgi:hypothetical protein
MSGKNQALRQLLLLELLLERLLELEHLRRHLVMGRRGS